MLGRDLDDAGEKVRTRSEAAAALADRVAALAASAAGRDGAIRVTVNSSGAVTALELEDRARERPAADLATDILGTIRRAQAGLVEQAREAVEETVGADSDTGQAVLDGFVQRFPAPPDDAPEPVMPAPPPFPAFHNRPSLPHQAPGGGFESGRDSRAR